MLKYVTTSLAALAIAAVGFGAYKAGDHSARAQSTILFPSVTGVGIPTTAGGTEIVAANPSRKYIEICNASVTNDLWIQPTSTPVGTIDTLTAGGEGAYLVSQRPAAGATIGTVMNCYRTPAGIQSAGSRWIGLGVTGTANVTVFEY